MSWGSTGSVENVVRDDMDFDQSEDTLDESDDESANAASAGDSEY